MDTLQRREAGEALAVVRDMEVPGRRPRGRPMKSWLATVEEDIRELDIDSGLVNDRGQWKQVIARLTTRSGNTRRQRYNYFEVQL